MALIVNIKRQRALEWEKIIEESNESLPVVSTMDVFIKSRAGDIKGYANSLLHRFEISLFCMVEFESFDLPQVVAALANVPVRTLLMVGDEHQRVDTSRRGGRRATFVTEVGFDATRLDSVEDADEDPASSHLSAAQCSNGELHSTSFTVPESRPWYIALRILILNAGTRRMQQITCLPCAEHSPTLPMWRSSTAMETTALSGSWY